MFGHGVRACGDAHMIHPAFFDTVDFFFKAFVIVVCSIIELFIRTYRHHKELHVAEPVRHLVGELRGVESQDGS